LKKPDQLSLVSMTSSSLAIMDLKKIDNLIYTLGKDGKIAKWDYRKLEKPIVNTEITT